MMTHQYAYLSWHNTWCLVSGSSVLQDVPTAKILPNGKTLKDEPDEPLVLGIFTAIHALEGSSVEYSLAITGVVFTDGEFESALPPISVVAVATLLEMLKGKDFPKKLGILNEFLEVDVLPFLLSSINQLARDGWEIINVTKPVKEVFASNSHATPRYYGLNILLKRQFPI